MSVTASSSPGHPLFDWGISTVTYEGEPASGDGYVVAEHRHGMLVGVVDGLGHGQEAADAAGTAIATIRRHAHEPLTSIVNLVHDALRRTRGVVMNLVSFPRSDNSMVWIGIGNVEGILLRSDPALNPRKIHIAHRGGVVGYQLPQIVSHTLPVGPGDLLVFATDGIKPDFDESIIPADPPERIADRICTRHFKGNDDGLVLVLRYRGWP